MKRIYIVADLPGCSGVRAAEQCRWGGAAWREARNYLAAEVNAAAEGAYSAGADEVLVCDTYGGRGCCLPIEKLDGRALVETPNRDEMLPGLADDFAGLFIVGAHAMAGAPEAFMPYTVDPEVWFRYRLAGRECGEIGMWAVYAGHHGVPVLLVAGDEAACREAGEFIRGVSTVTVKEAVACDRARTLHPSDAAERIRAAAGGALGLADKIAPCLVDMPNEAELEYARTDFADAAAERPGAERVGPRTVRRALESALDVRKGF